MRKSQIGLNMTTKLECNHLPPQKKKNYGHRLRPSTCGASSLGLEAQYPLLLQLFFLFPLPKTMTTSIPIQTIQNPLLNNKFSLILKTQFSSSSFSSHRITFTPSAKFDLSKLLGGRGLCNGEAGIQKELKRTIQQQDPSLNSQSQPTSTSTSSSFIAKDESFDKELLGLTGGFPGGEKGLRKFIEENPPPKKKSSDDEEVGIVFDKSSKPRAPELPLFLPGMIVLVKNEKNPYHMYCGIVQRVTDGKAGVLFEGGNWDRLITFNLDELERREKGPPMVNPKSVILESIVEKSE